MPLSRTVERDGALSLASRAAGGLAMLAGQALLARALGPEGVGGFNLALYAATAMATVATLGLPTALTRFLAESAGAGDAAAEAGLLRFALRASAGGLAAVAALVAVLWIALPASRVGPLAAVLALAAALAARKLAAAAAQGLGDFRGQLRAALLGAAVLPLGAALVLDLHLGVGAALCAAALHFAAGALLLSRPAASVARAAPAWRPPPALFAYCRGVLALLLLDLVVWQQSDAIFLRWLSTPAALGDYSVSAHLATQAMMLAPGSLAAALFPALARHVGARDSGAVAREFHRALATLTALAVPVALVGMAAAEPLLVLLCGPRYADAAPALRVLLLGGAVGAVAAAASTRLYAEGRQGVLLRIGLAAAALDVVLDLALIPVHGALGAAWASTAAQVLAGGAALAFTLRERPVAAPRPQAAP